MQKLFSLIVLSLLVSLVGRVHGQVTPGKPTFVPEDCQDVACVDLLNNNISLNLPVMSKNGSLPFSFEISGNSYMFSTNAIWEAAMQQNLPLGSANGFLSSTLPLFTNLAHPGTVCNIGTGTTTKYTNWQMQAADGTLHPLPLNVYADKKSDGTSCLTGSGFTATTSDRSGYTMTVTANAIPTSVFGRNGMLYSETSVLDSNSNSILLSGGEFGDSMGLLVFSYGSSPNFGPFSWTDVDGGSPQVTVGTSNLTLQSNFNCSGIGEEHGFTDPMPTSYSFPDGTSLGITYEKTPGYSGDYTGRINQITLRQGGTIAYTYGPTTNNGIDCTYQTVPVLTRTLGNGDKTTYTLAHTPISGGSTYKATNTVVDPGGNQTIYTFTGFTSAGNSTTYTQALTEVQRYQGNGSGATLLATDIYCYNYAAFSNCSTLTAPTASVTSPITKQLVFHNLKGMSTYSATETWFDTYGNVTYSAQYDFNGSTPTRATTITYGSCTANCNTASPTITAIGSNVSDRPGEVVTTQNGSSSIRSRPP